MLRALRAREFQDVEEEDGEGYDDRLPHLHTINASENVDGISTEHSQHPHIHKVQDICRGCGMGGVVITMSQPGCILRRFIWFQPMREGRGAGKMMVVDPPLTRYTMRRGKEARVGRRTLCRHLRFSTSSANPRKIMQHTDSKAQINWENWREIKAFTKHD